MFSMKMRTVIKAAVLVAIYCVATQADFQIKTPDEAQADNPESITGERFVDTKAEPDNNQQNAAADQTNDDQSGTQVIERRLNGKDAPFEVALAQIVPKGKRKRSLDITSIPFDHVICFMFDSSYTDPKGQAVVRKIHRYIESRLCFTYIDVTLTLNASDPGSPMKLGCRSNSYVVYRVSSGGCSAYRGANPRGGAQYASPCNSPTAVIHELFHILLGIHFLEIPNIRGDVSVFKENINPGSFNNYVPFSNPASIYSLETDGTSLMRYATTTFGSNGDLTYTCNRPDKCTSYYSYSTEDTIFAELNTFYKCNEYACGNASVDCGKGYYGKVNGICQCVCSVRYDPATNCKTLINGTYGPKKWPTKAIILSGGPNYSCPVGTVSDGTLSICADGTNSNGGPYPIPTDGSKAAFLNLCTVTDATSTDMAEWPFGGDFCIIKPLGVSCGGSFNLFTVSFNNLCPASYNGTTADISLVGNRTTIAFCCKSEFTSYPIVLPNDQPFHMFGYYYPPTVVGMKSYYGRLSSNVANRSYSGGPASVKIFDLSWGFYMDLYTMYPPKYSGNLDGILGVAQSSVPYSTPGFPNPRPANTRSIFCASLEPRVAGVILVTFKNVSVGSGDDFMMNRFGWWNPNAGVNIKNPPVDLVSEGNSFCLEYWSDYNPSTATGVSVTFQSVLAAQHAYNYTINGADYIGTKNFTENNEPCLYWKDTRDCYDDQRTATDELVNYVTDNHCRNFGGLYKQPICYTYKNGSNCVKQNCDVSEIQQVQDKLRTCPTDIAANPDLCKKDRTRLLCAKSCNSTTPTLAPCPPSFTPFGTRCVYISNKLYNRTGALAACAALAPNARLLRVRDADDLYLLRQQRYLQGSSKIYVWVDGEQIGSGPFYYRGTNISLMFTNFSSDLNIASLKDYCAAIYTENGPVARQGAMYAWSCSNPAVSIYYACETERIPSCGQFVPPADSFISSALKPSYFEGDRLEIRCQNPSSRANPVYTMCKGGSWTAIVSACSAAADKYSTCQEALSSNARFCQYPDAADLCSRSCGVTGARINCTAPSSTSYARTSSSASIGNGEFMTFACVTGTYLTSGDTARACGLDGSLLGQEPVCTPTPPLISIGQSLLMQRPSTVAQNELCLLTRDDFMVPRDGKITTWTCMTVSDGNVTFVVYRPSGSSYTLVGFNTVSCQPGSTWEVPVRSQDQISVQAGDVVGAFATVTGTLYATQCSSSQVEWILPCASVNGTAVLSTAAFSTTKCRRYSVAYELTTANPTVTKNVAHSASRSLASSTLTNTKRASTSTTIKSGSIKGLLG